MIVKNNPLISILINNYNYGHFLEESINSALNQTYKNTEIIVVDDGSIDNSREIIKSYEKKLIPIFKMNGGQASTFNAGFLSSNGEIICFLDSDDFFYPEKVETVVTALGNNHTLGWCFHPLKLIGNVSTTDQKKRLNNGKSKICDVTKYVKDGKTNIANSKFPFGVPATSGLCFRRSLLEKILPMPEADNVTISDRYLKWSALGLSKGIALNRELAIQRIHDKNIFTMSDRRSSQKLRARIFILTAYYMRLNFPVLTKFADDTFAEGLGIHLKVRKTEPQSNVLIKAYMSPLSLPDRYKIWLRAIHYSIAPIIENRINKLVLRFSK